MLGGVSTVLFGLIAITGARIWVENRVDFSRGVNLFVAAVAIIVGAANYTVHFGNFTFEGITLGTFGAIILYQIFRIADPGAEDPVADPPTPSPSNREYDVPATSYPDRPRRASGARRGRQQRRPVDIDRDLGDLPDLPGTRRPREEHQTRPQRQRRQDPLEQRRRRRRPVDDE